MVISPWKMVIEHDFTMNKWWFHGMCLLFMLIRAVPPHGFSGCEDGSIHRADHGFSVFVMSIRHYHTHPIQIHYDSFLSHREKKWKGTQKNAQTYSRCFFVWKWTWCIQALATIINEKMMISQWNTMVFHGFSPQLSNNTIPSPMVWMAPWDPQFLLDVPDL